MNSSERTVAALGVLLIYAATAVRAQAPGTDTLLKYWIAPAATDSTIKRFNEPNYIVFERHVKPSAPLIVFLPGTDGRPAIPSSCAAMSAHGRARSPRNSSASACSI